MAVELTKVCMSLFFVSLCASLVATYLVIVAASRSAHSHDNDLSGPQKFHAVPVPRVGGGGILSGVLVAWVFLIVSGQSSAANLLGGLLIAAAPTFFSGVAEDLTKNVSPRRRLAFTALSAAVAAYLLDAKLGPVGIPGLDWALSVPLIAAALTVFAVTGLTNAVNIIDGFNGLAAACVAMMLAAFGFVSYCLGDQDLLIVCVLLIGSIAGFFVFNFPMGKIFLGDGGAYFLGFMLAELAVLLLSRHPELAASFPLLVCAYPVFETLFSIYRKLFLRNMSPGVPDGVHLHMLVYKRLMRVGFGVRTPDALTRRNSYTSPYLWALCAAAVGTALLFWRTPAAQIFALLCFAGVYVWLYWRIVRFQAPKFLVVTSAETPEA